MRYLRLLLLRVAICTVASLGFIGVLSQVHDYTQTRQAFHDFNRGDGLAWLIGFYFLNEAGSGIKYALTGDEKHLDFFPTADRASMKEEARRSYRVALLDAEAGDWQEQLRVSHLFALGWGVVEDRTRATDWYLRSEARAREIGELAGWQGSRMRTRVLAIITQEIMLERLAREMGDGAATQVTELLLDPSTRG